MLIEVERCRIAALGTGGTLLLTVAAAAQSNLTPVKLTVIAPGTNDAQFTLARSEGWFVKNGLDVEFIKAIEDQDKMADLEVADQVWDF